MKSSISQSINDVTGKSWNFTGLQELLQFLKTERDFWNKAAEGTEQPHKFVNFRSNLTNAVNTIEGWEDAPDQWNDQEIQQNMRPVSQQCFGNMAGMWLWSGHDFTPAFIECNRQHGEQAAEGFYGFITTGAVNNVNNPNYFIGIMTGYEFKFQSSEILKRRKSEKASFNQLRNRLDETTQELIAEVAEFKSDYKAWETGIADEWNKWINKSSTEHESHLEKGSDEFRSFMNSVETERLDLESTYAEKLKLEAPAKYWDTAAINFRREGRIWSAILILTVFIGLFGFGSFYVAWLEGQNQGVQLSTIQGIVLFGTGLAIYAFLVRVLSRLTFSSFHLMRDAQEREQLTYLYLSLINEKSIDESSRDIVLQALFSRTETGLLAAEHGPTMPGHLAEMAKGASRS